LKSEEKVREPSIIRLKSWLGSRTKEDQGERSIDALNNALVATALLTNLRHNDRRYTTPMGRWGWAFNHREDPLSENLSLKIN
jgi:hypothetical protein